MAITCYKSRVLNKNGSDGNSSSHAKTAKGKKTVDVPRSPVQAAIETMKKDDNGLGGVDHELYFVEYADHVHDLVWGQNQQEQAGWIKQQSLDAQSIDISTSKPYDSSYEVSSSSAPTPPPRAVLPSYVVLGGQSPSPVSPGARKISDQLQEEGINMNDKAPSSENFSNNNSSSYHPRRGSIKLAGITIFGGCSASRIKNAVPYKSKKVRRGHV